MRSMLVAAVVFAVSCGGAAGEKGPAGDQGPAGEQGPRGEPGYSGLVWVDANGALVGPYAESPIYVDDAGVLWPVNSETAELDLATRDTAVGWFESADCTGVAYALANPPSVAYLVPSGMGTGLTRAVVRSATQASVSIHAHSQLGESSTCGFADLNDLMVPTSSLSAVAPPNFQFAAPLRLAIQ